MKTKRKVLAKQPATPEQQKARSLAAYKAHLTRQRNALARVRKPERKAAVRAAIESITARMLAV
jgi:hypothetical protein